MTEQWVLELVRLCLPGQILDALGQQAPHCAVEMGAVEIRAAKSRDRMGPGLLARGEKISIQIGEDDAPFAKAVAPFSAWKELQPPAEDSRGSSVVAQYRERHAQLHLRW